MTFETMEDAEAEARRRFAERAEEVRENLEEAFFDTLPGNHSPAEAVLLAHLMTTTDGYNDVQFVGEWDKRAKMGWATSMAFLAELDRGLVVPFAAEARYNNHSRQLAILIDRSEGVRLIV